MTHEKNNWKETMPIVIEHLKSEFSAFENDDCPNSLRQESAATIATAFPDLAKALEESVKLQSHYADLLNMYDGGRRMTFDSADDWLKRLYECGTLSRTESGRKR